MLNVDVRSGGAAATRSLHAGSGGFGFGKAERYVAARPNGVPGPGAYSPKKPRKLKAATIKGRDGLVFGDMYSSYGLNGDYYCNH